MRSLPLLLMLALASCGEHAREEELHVRSTSPPAPTMLAEQRQLMGTIFSIQVVASEALGRPAIDAGFTEIARLEQVLSEWIPTSEISRVNAGAGGRGAVQLSEDGYRVVRTGVEVSRFSEGAFDLSWAALRDLYTFRAGDHAGPTIDARTLRTRLGLVDYQQILLDDAAKSVRLGRSGMAIGTGAIGKGYAMDRAGEIIVRAGIESYMIYGGGQVQVHGLKQGRPWRIGIQHPRAPDQYFAYIESTGGSVSTSGDYEHYFFDTEGNRVHHIIDTDLGTPARASISVTLITAEGIYADALSTAVFVMGPERGLAMLASLPFRVDAVIVDAQCKVHVTPGLEVSYRMPPDERGILPECEGRP